MNGDTVPLAGGRRPSGPENMLQRFRVNRVNSLVPPAGMGETIPEHGPLELTAVNGGTKPNSAGRKSSTFSIRSMDDGSISYDTKQGFEQRTREALPRMDNYRNAMSIAAAHRPTLDELHEEAIQPKTESDENDGQKGGGAKFGWIEGVLVRCLLNIWGVMLFLRLSWMVAQSGIAESMAVIILSTLVTVMTTLSMSAISTNGEIKGGGIYYMISRSLGPEFGGAVGVVFSFANAANAALNTVGFSESLNDLLKETGVKIVDSGTNDIRITGSIALIAMQTVICIGMAWEAKLQVVLLIILLVAMFDFFIGALVGPMGNVDKIARGFVGMNGTVFMDNMWQGYRKDEEGQTQTFFTVFSIFFPAVAGIQAGASISGDLKDPSSAIPKGTLWSIAITTLSYALFALLAGAGSLRLASGNSTQVNDNWDFANCTDQPCPEGMYNNYQVMALMSLYNYIIYGGCFAATLSSALSCLVSGAKTFQALAEDHIYPYISIFGKTYRNGDPYFSYALGFIIAAIFILIGDLNAIAPLISNFFIASYALLNFCTFHAAFTKPVGWRPTFKYYNAWLSLGTFILCAVVMFLMSWVTALITWAIIIALFVYVVYRKPDVNWGSSGQAQNYKSAIAAVQQLNNTNEHVKNFRPQILLLSGKPQNRPSLVDFGYLLTKNLSLLICGHISEETEHPRIRNITVQRVYNWFQLHQIKSFFVFVDNLNLEEGTRALMQATGVGKMTPNIIMMGFKEKWESCPRDELSHYFNVLHNAFDNYMAVTILRVKGGLNFTGEIFEGEESPHNSPTANGHIPTIPSVSNIVEMARTDSNLSQMSHGSDNTNSTPNTPISTRVGHEAEIPPIKKKKKRGQGFVYLSSDGNELPKEKILEITQFQRKQRKGTIDVWWLYDDGGLTLLLPYIISSRKNWSSCKLRVFALANKKDELEVEQRSMASLLSKFRIDYSDLMLLPDVTRKAGEETKRFFNHLIRDFRGVSNVEDDNVITDAELTALKEKTNRHLRLREMLMEYSSDANLIVMTLPMPRKGVVSAPLYMAWLDVLTRDMPPFLLVRGNQTSVLTFYS